MRGAVDVVASSHPPRTRPLTGRVTVISLRWQRASRTEAPHWHRCFPPITQPVMPPLKRSTPWFFAAVLLLLTSACAESEQTAPEATATDATAGWPTALDSTDRIATSGGFSGPEGVRYDPDQDVYFVSNFNGSGGDRDNNGFISTLGPDGTVQQRKFIVGGQNGVTLHAPRGMALTGDTLWAADAGAVRGFNKNTGAPVATYDFSGRETGFLNDVTPGPDQALYVTDTGQNRLYKLSDGSISVALADTMLGDPNGITWDAARGRLVVVPYGGAHTLYGWQPGDSTLTEIGSSPGAQFDGVEVLPGGRLLVASQADSSLHLFENGRGRPFAKTGGAPADLGIDTQRMRAAVPFIDRNLVEIWQLPQE